MKHIDEYRDKKLVDKLLEEIGQITSRPWTLMEICGGQTHTIMKYSLQDLLPSEITLIHGPGCPVCVTPREQIDRAISLALEHECIVCSFGDMLRVPGSSLDLLSARARGGDVRTVYSPLDTIKIAKENPEKNIVFFAVGFETTAPAVALAADQALQMKLSNLFFLVAHVLVPPAMELLLSAPDARIDGFLAAGHVCTVMGYHEYIPLAEKYKIPISVTGFEPVDILLGINQTVKMLEENTYGVSNAYPRSVKEEGNLAAQQLLKKVFVSYNRNWRGIGVIPDSGYQLTGIYKSLDAELRFDLEILSKDENTQCIAGEILTGNKKPFDCKAFGKECKPENPLGAPMVSSEGACAAYYRYKQIESI